MSFWELIHPDCRELVAKPRGRATRGRRHSLESGLGRARCGIDSSSSHWLAPRLDVEDLTWENVSETERIATIPRTKNDEMVIVPLSGGTI
jgi:hypothetical protein